MFLCLQKNISIHKKKEDRMNPQEKEFLKNFSELLKNNGEDILKYSLELFKIFILLMK